MRGFDQLLEKLFRDAQDALPDAPRRRYSGGTKIPREKRVAARRRRNKAARRARRRNRKP